MAGGHDQAAGAAIGGTLGLLKSLTVITTLNWTTVAETAILAAVGAGVGFMVTGALKFLKNQYESRKKNQG